MQAPEIHITIDDDGIPRTINGWVKVHMLATMLQSGESVEALAEHYNITLADVYAALAYYFDNRAYFEERERERQPYIEEAKRYTAELRGKIEARMHQRED